MAPQIDWKNLGFSYLQTDYFVKADFIDGAWGGVEVCSEPSLNIHVAATCLHYGQACFEGLKAFCRNDNSIAIFRPRANAARLADSARRLVMEVVPEELFVEAVRKVVLLNKAWVPPYATGASLYIRPLLIGTTPRVGLNAATDYSFIVMAMPVGPYYKNGFFPVNALVQEELDRAAPRGVGHVKAAGNYAAGMMGDLLGKKKGYPISLYLDSAHHRYIDEFGTSNFFAITRDGAYVTPQSSSILPSITNDSLQTIAADIGLRVQKRPIAIEELTEFSEVGACGTAAVITPIHSITRGDTVYTFGSKEQAGETLCKLHKTMLGIQYGELPDTHGWMLPVMDS
jgi:branched-chain amino acid aminotransferase